MNEINKALLYDFIDESKEHLDEMESLLLKLSNDLGNSDLLNDIFRTMHNVKGASQITGLDRISRLSHRLEDLLDLLRQGQMEATQETVNLLISGRDQIVQLVSELGESQQELSTVEELIDQINLHMERDESADNEDSRTPVTVESGRPVEPVISSPTVFDDGNYEEKHDEELFAIFLEQLKQQTALLSRSSSQFRDSDADIEQVGKCRDAVNRLRSSANYMGYDEMVELFDQWIDELENAAETLSNGEVGSLEFMDRNLDHLITRFPQLADSREPGFTPEQETEAEVSGNMDDDVTSSVLDHFNDDMGGDEWSEETPDEVENKINLALLNDFIDESRENLEEMESLLIKLGADMGNMDILNEIFRTMHNIKGASQLAGLDKISRLAHRLEDLLDLLRQQDLSTDSATIELLITCHDRILKLVGELEQSQQEITPIDDLVEQLAVLIERSGSALVESPSDIDQKPVEPAAESRSVSAPASSVPRIEVSDINEEHDQELFSIFVSHLQEQLASISSHTRQLQDSPDQQARLKDCIKNINSLFASANYMGYENLADSYQRWIDGIEKIIKAISRGEQVSLDIMDAYPAELTRIFPQIKPDLAGDGTDQAVDIKPVVSQVETAMGQGAHTTRQEHELFDRMNSALESSLQKASSSEDETLKEVFDELVSTQGNGRSAQAGNSSESGGAASAQALKEVAKPSDRRIEGQRILDRRDSDRRGTDRRQGGDAEDKKVRKSVRVDAEKIDVLMNQVGELVVDRSYFFQLFNEMRELQQHLKDTAGIDQKEVKLIRAFTYRLSEAISGLGRTSNELQEGVMKMRMLPVSHLFNRYPRLVHDLTSKLDKKVNLILSGEETELDRMIVEELSDPLIHIIRNAIDHGIESSEERVEKGKPDEGKLILEAFQESNHIVIQVTDDGRGLDPEKIKQKAVSNGLYSSDEVERLNEHEVFNIILMPGFSTADKITGTSGRGVGMDVVRKNIEKLNGTLDIDSKPGKGTQMRLKIPLTLAIIHALMVRVGKDMFTIPLANVDETVRISRDETSLVEGVEVIYLRGVALPVFRLSSLFKVSADKDVDKSFVVIVNTDGQRIGFVVDELLGQEEVVIKPLIDYVQEKSGFSGATVIGDGRISLILDVYELVKMTTRRQNMRQKKQAEMLKLTRPRLPESTEAQSDRLH